MAAPALNAVRRESEAEVACVSPAGVLPGTGGRRAGLVPCIAWNRGLRRIQALIGETGTAFLGRHRSLKGQQSSGSSVSRRGVTRARDPRSVWLGTSSFLASVIPQSGPCVPLPPGAPLPKASAHWAFSQILPIITYPPTLLVEGQGK